MAKEVSLVSSASRPSPNRGNSGLPGPNSRFTIGKAKTCRPLAFPPSFRGLFFSKIIWGLTNDGRNCQIHPPALIGYTKVNNSMAWQDANFCNGYLWAITSNGGYVKIIWPLNAGAASFLPITPVFSIGQLWHLRSRRGWQNRHPYNNKTLIIIDNLLNPTLLKSPPNLTQSKHWG